MSEKLFATDFDGTYALTQELAPNGMNVTKAYDAAVLALFGEQGFSRYTSLGGLQNRAPSEVVSELLPGLDEEVLHQRTEDLVQIKLSFLSKQIGQKLHDGEIWPRLAPGFKDVWDKISQASTMSTAVISSGHTDFIKRFHEVHELTEADILLTDDDMRPLAASVPAEVCVKPSRLLLDSVFIGWLGMRGLGLDDWPLELRKLPSTVTYTGDDANKDGNLARNFGAGFIHIDTSDYASSWKQTGKLVIPCAEAQGDA
jgi:hypothetical protein